MSGFSLFILFCLIEVLFIAGGLGMYLGSRRVDNSVRCKRWIKFVGYFFIVHLITITSLLPKPFFSVVMSILLIAGCIELILASHKLLTEHAGIFFWGVVVYLLLATGAIGFSLLAASGWSLYIYLIICSLDAASQIFGQLLGKRPLAPQISPHKTVEGACGGIIVAFTSSITLQFLVAIPLLHVILIGLIVIAAGLIGDLTGSAYKRYLKIKDYSRILPGQGGIIDRFNSYLTAMAFMSVYSLISRHY